MNEFFDGYRSVSKQCAISVLGEGSCLYEFEHVMGKVFAGKPKNLP
jgi:hypothetical protein